MSNLRTLQNHIKSSESLVKLEILFLKGSLSKEVNMNFLANFIETLTARCLCLRRLDLSSNDLGKPGNPALSSIISQLTSLRRDFDLSLNPEYMLEVDNSFICIMEETIRNKGTIDHTIAHGIIVGPGRSGKNTLMSRLMGIRSNPDIMSPSTGVMETVVKVEVKKICTVATAVSNLNLKWQRLEYDEEALELIMTTTRNYSASQPVLKPVSKCIIDSEEQQMQGILTTNLAFETGLEIKTETMSSPRKQKAKIAKFFSKLSKPFTKLVSKQSSKTVTLENTRRKVEKISAKPKNVVMYSSALEPVDILKRAVKLRRMDALREHLESSWSLYLTNTGGQIEFQEHLSLLACGPSIFFITFPLHHDLEQPYEVRYEYPDSQVKSYQSTTTLLEELLQTLATIDALKYASEQYCESDVDSIKPKVYFVGTHRDKLVTETTAEKTIEEIDKLLQTFVRHTSLFRQGSIQFAQLQPTQKLMFAVNNLSVDDNEFQKIRSAVQQTVERRKDFTVTCPSTWLVFSLILRAKHKSSQVLSFEECFSIAQQCGISDRRELSQALSFIHSRLGLVRYFNVKGLNELVIIDPQVLFDRITDLLVNTFTYSHAEVNQIEDFYQRGILPIAVVESIDEKCGSDVQLPFPWLTKLLNYLRIAALFRDQDGDKYFFSAALCHAPEPLPKQSPSFDSPSPILIGFESGFCPRGVPGALIKILMTNEMKSKLPWELRPNKIFRNQVSFGIESYGDVTLKFFPTHLEIFLDSDNDITQDELSTTCTEACTQIKESMEIVSNQFSECPCFLGFYCTLAECQAHPHPAKIEWRGGSPSKLKCKIMDKRGRLPTGYYHYFFRDVPHLDKEIDFCNKGVPKHLGQIAESMAEWEGRIADELGLTEADVASIKIKYPSNLKLQLREALYIWKRKLGSNGTYRRLIEVFERAGYKTYADSVIRIVFESGTEMRIVNEDVCEEESPSLQPSTYPPLKPLNKLSDIPIQLQSPQEEYMRISTATAKTLPKGFEVYNQNVLDSCHVRNVPVLQENMAQTSYCHGHIPHAHKPAPPTHNTKKKGLAYARLDDKIGKSSGRKEKKMPHNWRPMGRLEWGAFSGHQLTLTDVSVNELSKVEMQTLKRLSVPKLQAMDIPVTYGLLKSVSRNMLPRLSTFKQQKVNAGDKSEMEQPSVVFGQPLQKLLPQNQVKNHSGSSTPVLSLKDQRLMSLCPADPQVPDIVRKAIHYLDRKGVMVEGIFRIPGEKTRIDKIREKFDSGEDVELTDDINPHDMAGLLKEFFRSLPEPLLTRDLYQPFLTTRNLTTPALRRDALRYLCLLLPQANRDTLEELLHFLSRVALRSNGIVLIDGTEEPGNLMTERNLGMIIGPIILHKRKNQKGDYRQPQKLDAKELSAICKVIEDLIQMQSSIFMIPAKMYDECLRDIMTSDPEALDQLLNRKCYEQGLFPESPDMGLNAHTRSTEALRKVWEQRRRSFSDTQRLLDEAIENLEKSLNEEIERARKGHKHSSSTDFAMGESETEGIVSPIRSSPILNSRVATGSQLYALSPDHTHTESAMNITHSPSSSSLDSSRHRYIDDNTII